MFKSPAVVCCISNMAVNKLSRLVDCPLGDTRWVFSCDENLDKPHRDVSEFIVRLPEVALLREVCLEPSSSAAIISLYAHVADDESGKFLICIFIYFL